MEDFILEEEEGRYSMEEDDDSECSPKCRGDKALEIEHLLQYIGDMFEYHADQRLRTFRYFLLYLIAICVSFYSLFTREHYQILLGVSFFSFLITLMFFLLEIRGKQLTDNAIEGCKFIENELIQWLPNPKGIDLSNKRKQEYYKAIKIMNINMKKRSCIINYSFSLKTIYVLSLTISIIVGAMAIAKLDFSKFFHIKDKPMDIKIIEHHYDK